MDTAKKEQRIDETIEEVRIKVRLIMCEMADRRGTTDQYLIKLQGVYRSLQSILLSDKEGQCNEMSTRETYPSEG